MTVQGVTPYSFYTSAQNRIKDGIARYEAAAAKPFSEASTTDLAAKLTFGAFSLAHSASQKDVSTQIAESTLRKVKRKAAGAGAEQAAQMLSARSGEATGQQAQGFSQKVYQKLGLTEETKRLLQERNNRFEAYSAAGLFGLGRTRAANFSWQAMKSAAAENFKNARLMPKLIETAADGSQVAKPLTAGGFLKYGVVGEMIRRISLFLSTGKGFFEAAMGGLALGFMALNMGLVMKKAHDKSSEKGDGLLTRMFKTAFSGVKELVKTIAAMQVSALAYATTYAAVTMPVVGAATAMLGAATAGVFTYMGLKKIDQGLFGKD